MATGTRGWNWVQRTEVYSPNGSNKDGRVIYEDLKILFVEDDKFRVTRSKGTIVEQYVEIILPVFQLRSVELEEEIYPLVNRTFFVKGNDSYKVIGVMDKTEDPEYFCYFLTVRRDNINA